MNMRINLRIFKQLWVIAAFSIIVVISFSGSGLSRNWDWDQNHDCVEGLPGASGWGRYAYNTTSPDDYLGGDYTSKDCCELYCKACPVYANTGRYQKTFTDLSVPGVGPALNIIRTYNSQEWSSSLLGYSWTFNFGKKLIITRNQNGEKIIGVLLTQGEKNYYRENLDGTLTRLTDYGATYDLIKKTNNTYAIYNNNGSRYELHEDGKIDKIIDRNQNELVFSYNSVGCLSRITNASGNYIDFQLGPNGKIASISDNLGRTIAYGYDDNGNLITVTDPLRHTTQYTYNSNTYLTQIIDAKGNVVEAASYDDNQPPRISSFTEKGETYTIAYFDGRTEKTDSSSNKWTYYFNDVGVIEKVIDPLGNVKQHQLNKVTATSVDWEEDLNGNRTTYTYDSDGNIATKTDPLGNTWTYSYVAGTDLLETETNPLGVITRYQYDGNGNQTEIVEDAGGVLESTTTYTYNSHGNQISTTDSLGNTTTYEYDTNGNMIRKADPLGNVSIYSYDSRGNKLTETDALGHITSYAYDLMNQLTSITDAFGNSVTYTYDANGNKSTEVDANGNTRIYAYDAYNRLIQETDPLGNNTSYDYDYRDNQTSVTDANGNTTVFTYDITDRLICETNALGGQKNYTYDGVGNILTVTNAVGNTVTFTYDATNRKVKTSSGAGQIITYTYDMLGNVLTMTDANGNNTVYEYDNLGRKIKETNALNGEINFLYDVAGNLLSVTNANGHATHFTYNANNRKIAQQNAAGETTTYDYDAKDNLIKETRPNGNTITRIYDSMNRIVSMADSLGVIKNTTYDIVGNILTDTNGLGESTSYTYDVIGRRISQTDAMGNTNVYTYDSLGNVLSITDPDGNITQYSFNGLNQKLSETDPLGHITVYSYNNAGQLVSITDTKGKQTSFLYNEANQVIRKTYADGSFYTYTYDPVGNLASRTDAMGQVTTYSYDNLNRLLRVNYSDLEYREFSYDSMGNMLSANTDSSTISFVYDNTYRITKTVQNDHSVSYAYNLAENSKTIIYPNGKMIKEIYNHRNILNRIEDSDAVPIINYSLDSVSRFQKKNYANGIEGIYTRNVNGQVEVIEYKKGDTQLIGLGYNYNADNTISFKEKSHAPDSSESYNYDAMNQLTGYKVGQLIADNIFTPSSEIDYIFDPMGNWESMIVNGITQTRSHNSLNQIIYINGVNSLYDANGNLVNDGSKIYDYNAENRLIKVTRISDNQVLAQYAYDALGRRITKTTSTKTTNFVYDGNSFLTLAELSSNGTIEKTFVWGLDLSGGKEIGGIGGLIEVEDISSGRDYIALNDVNGNVVMLADADTGEVTGEYTYSPFGEVININGRDAAANPFRFSSKYYDGETLFYYYGYRYYSPEFGRFLRQDPIKEIGFLIPLRIYQLSVGGISITCSDQLPVNVNKHGELPFWIQDAMVDGRDANPYVFANNTPTFEIDLFGLKSWRDCEAPSTWRKKKNGVIPPADGCSAPRILPGTPNNPGWFLDCDQEGSCNNHDSCYSDCSKTRSECDVNLRNDMASQCQSCASRYPNTLWGRLRRAKFLQRCTEWAGDYWVGVRIGGAGPYKNRQTLNCECSCK